MKGTSGNIQDSKHKVKEELMKKYGFVESSTGWCIEKNDNYYVMRKEEVKGLTFAQLKGELNEITKRTISNS